MPTVVKPRTKTKPKTQRPPLWKVILLNDDFTAREFDLLRYLVAHTGQVVTREELLNQVWGYEESPTTRTIDNFVAKLRQKIERAPHEPEHILTVHGAGYKFVG